MKRMQKYKILLSVMSFTLLSACAASTAVVPTENDVATAMAAVTQPGQPDATAAVVPTEAQASVFVALVNGEGITETSYLASLTQFEAAQAETGALLAADESAMQQVLESLIARMLLAQAARLSGYLVEDANVDVRMNQLADQVGGLETLAAWQTANGYTPESFRADLRLEMEASFMREQILSSVPETMPQVEARQVFFYDEFSALRIHGQLVAGASFQQVVDNNDPRDLGYLGWFPQGYLLSPEIETAAFALEVGQYSDVIVTELGFHIIEVLAVAADRSISADARLTLQLAALDEWMSAQRDASLVEIYIP